MKRKQGRPEHPVIDTRVNHRGYDVQLQYIDQVFQLTHSHRICLLRQDRKITYGGFKYVKTCWSSEASAKRAVEKYNRFFNTDQFGYIEVDVFGNPEQGTTQWPKSKNK